MGVRTGTSSQHLVTHSPRHNKSTVEDYSESLNSFDIEENVSHSFTYDSSAARSTAKHLSTPHMR
jgi:hypothetical protein